jgi:plastocyanin
MYLRRRAASAAFALATAFALSACTEADNGNNTLAGRKTRTTPPAPPQSTAPARAGEGIDLEAKDNVFAPEQITAKAGTITIVMRNTGVAPHTFTQSELGVDVNADGGKTAEIQLKDVKPGKYHFICKYHEALKMVGDLTVT